jgi:serine/threonine protein kinase
VYLSQQITLPMNNFQMPDFQTITQIGKGAYSSVFKAIHNQTQELIELQDNWIPLLAEINMVVDLRDETIVISKPVTCF